jgi:hypothetical protein
MSDFLCKSAFMLSVSGAPDYPKLSAYMLNAALQRNAIAPLWEVQTAKLQQNAGIANAGLTEEEQAAKQGLAAGLDEAYIASHSEQQSLKAVDRKRVCSFMVAALDLDAPGSAGAGTISTETLTQTANPTTSSGQATGAAISFDWDGQGYQKRTGWIGANDGMLVIDHDLNGSIDTGKELLSNPLIADQVKGMRSLAAYDTNGDGRIDAKDPLYRQLKVWQDLDQDGNNTHIANVAGQAVTVQDETGGVQELHSLSEGGISAVNDLNWKVVA